MQRNVLSRRKRPIFLLLGRDRPTSGVVAAELLGGLVASQARARWLRHLADDGYGFGIRMVRLIIKLPDRRNSRLRRWKSSPRTLTGDRRRRWNASNTIPSGTRLLGIGVPSK